MDVYDIVIDTNVLVAALRSKRGASYKLISLMGLQKYEIHISVAVILEYEDILQRQLTELGMSSEDISNLIDSICAVAHHHKIYFSWRPSLPNSNDEFLLELAVSAGCKYIVTHNTSDFKGSEKWGVCAKTPKDFLQLIDEVKK